MGSSGPATVTSEGVTGQGQVNPLVITLDTLAIVGDIVSIIPPAFLPGYLLSAGASAATLLMTVDAYQKGEAQWYDLTVSAATFLTGLIPVYGAIPAAGQLAYDLARPSWGK